MQAAPAIHCFLAPVRRSAAGQAPKARLSIHQGKSCSNTSIHFYALTYQLALHNTPSSSTDILSQWNHANPLLGKNAKFQGNGMLAGPGQELPAKFPNIPTAQATASHSPPTLQGCLHFLFGRAAGVNSTGKQANLGLTSHNWASPKSEHQGKKSLAGGRREGKSENTLLGPIFLLLCCQQSQKWAQSVRAFLSTRCKYQCTGARSSDGLVQIGHRHPSISKVHAQYTLTAGLQPLSMRATNLHKTHTKSQRELSET
eukprot:1141063-Pelagomonas_calceolata.AAC.3